MIEPRFLPDIQAAAMQASAKHRPSLGCILLTKEQIPEFYGFAVPRVTPARRARLVPRWALVLLGAAIFAASAMIGARLAL